VAAKGDADRDGDEHRTRTAGHPISAASALARSSRRGKLAWPMLTFSIDPDGLRLI